MQSTLIRALSDLELLTRLKDSVQEERKQTALVLEFLREVDRRRLYAESGYSSLWEFCTQELGYTEAAASRRIASMRLLREIPELKEDLVEGRQSLSSLSQAQRFFRIEEKQRDGKLSLEQKREILERLENKSTRQCERELLALSSAPIEINRPERERVIDETHRELKLVIDERLHVKLKRIQALRSHASPEMNYAELLGFMADEILRRLDPEERARSRRPGGTSPAGVNAVEMEAPQPPASEVQRGEARRRPIPLAIRRAVWLRDGGRCGWNEQSSGRACGSRHFLELDHFRPVALGGGNEASNLRLRCRAHNMREAIKVFGVEFAEGIRRLKS